MTDNVAEKKLDIYELVRLIGSGGMGEVYEAKHTLIGRRCAIKVLHQVLEANEEILTRMIREAQAASAIGHPNIIEVYDFRQAPGGSYYMVMELLEGASLEDVLDECDVLEPAGAFVVLSQVLSALGAAHEKGIVHRDLKPDNVFIAQNRKGGYEVKILDFGISKFTDPTGENMKLTKTGAVMGSPYYMSPEQASGKSDLDRRTDLWACGVMLFEMLTGDVPFPGDNYNEVLANILLKDPPDVSEYRDDLPEEVKAVLNKALQRDRNERYDNAEEMLSHLISFLPEKPVRVGGFSLVAQGSTFRKQKSDTAWMKIAHEGADLFGRSDEAGESESDGGWDKNGGSSQSGSEREYKKARSIPGTTRFYGEDKEEGSGEVEHQPSRAADDAVDDAAKLPLLPKGPKTTVTSGENISQSIETLGREGEGTRGFYLRLGLGLGLLLFMGIGLGYWLHGEGEKSSTGGDERVHAGVNNSGDPSRKGIGGSFRHKDAQDRTENSPKGKNAEAREQSEKNEDSGTYTNPYSLDAGGVEDPDKKTVRAGDAGTKDGEGREGGDADNDTIGVTLERVPAKARIWLDGKPVEMPIRVRRENKQRCLYFKAPGYKPYTRCFFAHRDRKLKLYMKKKSARGDKSPKSIYDSPYGQ